MKRMIFAMATAGLVAAGAASADTIYSNTFNAGLGGATTTGSAAIRTDNGITYLGNMTQGASASFAIDTSGFSNITLAFTLYAVSSLDGNGPNGGGADPFVVANGGTTVFTYNFANYNGGNTQNYGGADAPLGSYAPRTGQTAAGQLGFGTGDFGDATYLFSNIALTAGANGLLQLTFFGNSNQDIGDEFYGIDNIVVSGTRVDGVPEPATWAMMVAGFGMIAGSARRRKRAPKAVLA